MDDRQLKFSESLILSDQTKAEELIKESLENQELFVVLDDLVVPAMEHIGLQWEKDQISLVQVYMAGRICEEILNRLFQENDIAQHTHPKMAITILQDYHLLGKRIVSSFFKSSGLNLIDYGGGISVNELVDRIKEDQIEIILISALMLNTALKVKDLKKKLVDEELDVKILVGGAPFRFDPNLWKEVGADFSASTAGEGLNIIMNYIRVNSERCL